MTNATLIPETEPSDFDLARQVSNRRSLPDAQAAFQALVERHHRSLYVFVRANSGVTTADDLTQEIWLRVWQALGVPDRFDGQNFRAWVFTIARNQMIDASRRRELRSTPIDPTGDVPAIEPADPSLMAPEDAERRAAFQTTLAHCIEGLELAERQVVVARLEGARPSDIAARANVKPERVHKLFHQAKAKLRACVEHAAP